jgi:hypothetical protein
MATTLISGTTTTTFTSVGDGWYRCSVTATTIASGSSNAVVYAKEYSPYLGDGISGLFIWGAQLNEGTLKDYFATETRLNIPRLDYSNGSCPSLLVEPQRTNLALWSEQFDNAAWTKTNATVTTNSVNSPSGIQNADTLTANGLLNYHSVNNLTSIPVTAIQYTASIYAKKGTNDFIQILSSGVTGGHYANFNLANGVVGSVGKISGVDPTSTITDEGDGWYRCTMTFTAIAGNFNLYAAVAASATDTRAQTNSLSTSVYLWGAQLEAGAYPTSYIPTTSASVTRNNDIISKTSATALIGQTEGTFFVDFNYFALISAPSTIEVVPLEIGNGSANNRMYLSVFQGDLYVVVFTGGSAQVITNLGAITQGRHKVGVSYINNNLRAYLDGAFIASDTSVTLPTLSNIYIGSFSNATPQSHSINVVTLWKDRLSNDELTALTTL